MTTLSEIPPAAVAAHAFGLRAEAEHQTVAQHGLRERAGAIQKLRLLDPIGYLDFLRLMENAQLVLTDSGGIQEETTYLGVPCITLRENTERPITCEEGTNELCGLDVDLVVAKSLACFEGKAKHGRIPSLWDGHSAERIVQTLLQKQ